MSNLATSQPHRLTKERRLYVVTYLDSERNVSYNLRVWANCQHEATAQVITYIDAHNLHPYEHPYFVTPAIAPAKCKFTYDLTEK